jgi:hypothetical protein
MDIREYIQALPFSELGPGQGFRIHCRDIDDREDVWAVIIPQVLGYLQSEIFDKIRTGTLPYEIVSVQALSPRDAATLGA